MPADGLTAEGAVVYPQRQEEAWDRLTRAMQCEKLTRHLPPGHLQREANLREWRWAHAVAEEWGIE